MVTEPDPRTAPDEDGTTDDATNQGVSSTEPAEGDDDAPTGGDGSPEHPGR